MKMRQAKLFEIGHVIWQAEGQDAPHLSSNRGSLKSRDALASISMLAEEGTC
jgi:hypothetical protein